MVVIRPTAKLLVAVTPSITSRRRILKSVGAVTVGGLLAGCTDNDGGGGEGGAGGEGGEGGEDGTTEETITEEMFGNGTTTTTGENATAEQPTTTAGQTTTTAEETTTTEQ